jgi:hypothetical protein
MAGTKRSFTSCSFRGQTGHRRSARRPLWSREGGGCRRRCSKCFRQNRPKPSPEAFPLGSWHPNTQQLSCHRGAAPPVCFARSCRRRGRRGWVIGLPSECMDAQGANGHTPQFDLASISQRELLYSGLTCPQLLEQKDQKSKAHCPPSHLASWVSRA